MPTLDHLTIIAPNLELGVAHVRAQLGFEMGAGGAHPEMGTHNRLMSLGPDCFLEVIAVDPQGVRRHPKRWFGLDDREAVATNWEAGLRLRGWVALTEAIDGDLVRMPRLFETKLRVSRGDRVWDFAMSRDDTVPSLIDWGARGSPAPQMPNSGARLLSFWIEHPDPEALGAVYRQLEIAGAPEIRHAGRIRYGAEIKTPAGPRPLT